MIDLLVGRQPIFDRHRDVFGYELLFRSRDQDVSASRPDGTLMTASVLLSSMSIGVSRLVGDKKAFCNATREVLVGTLPLLLPPEQTVIEILEDVRPDAEVLAGCRRLAERGYALALDDFEWFDGAEAFLELAEIVKVDVQLVRGDRLPALLDRCRAFDVQLLAEKVETQAELEVCAALGFEYFQGYLLSRPDPVPGRSLGPGLLARLRLAGELYAAEPEVARLEEIIRSDPGMAHQLMQVAGLGAARGLRRNVRSLREAIVLVGERRLRSWVTLLLLLQDRRSADEDLVTAFVRARASELLAASIGDDAAGLAFAAGMLSTLDLLLDTAIGDILAELPLDSELLDAALRGGSPVGRLVDLVARFQVGELGEEVTGVLEEVEEVALQALEWAIELTAAVQGTVP